MSNRMSLWHYIHDVPFRVMKWSVVAALLSSAIILVISVTDVIGSKFFNRGIPAAVSFVAVLNLVVVFMSVAYVQMERGSIGIAFLNRYLSKGVNYTISLAGHVLGVLVCGFFSWRTLVLVQNMHATGAINAGAVVEFPLWPFAAVNFFGYAMLTLAFILCFVRGIIAGPER